MTLTAIHPTQPNEKLHLPKPFKKVQDPISCYTHFLGAIFSIILTITWTIIGLVKQLPLDTLLSCLVFCLSLVALYSASSYYHSLMIDSPKHNIFRKLDHSMIYVLIVGTYTPIIMAYSKNGIVAVLIMWAIALAGVTMKIIWLNAPRWLYTSLYILLGWSIVMMPSVYQNAPLGFLAWLLLGGLFYTIGGIFYILKKPNISNNWTFHETFHVLIMLGSLCHVIGIWSYIFH